MHTKNYKKYICFFYRKKKVSYNEIIQKLYHCYILMYIYLEMKHFLGCSCRINSLISVWTAVL